MHSTIQSSDSDVVECMFFVSDESLAKKEIYYSLSLNQEFGHDMEERQGPPAIWKYMVKKSFWTTNNILFPEIRTASDLAAYSLVFSLCERKCFLYEPLYIYRMVQSSLTHSTTSYENTLLNAASLCEYISAEFKKRNIFDKCKLKLISQAEHHLSLNASFYDSKEYYSQISSIIKKYYEVKYTMFDISVFGWGCVDIPSLCSALRKSPSKEINYITNTSLYRLCDLEMQRQLEQILQDISIDIAVIDLLSEATLIHDNIASISEYVRLWAIGCNTFLKILSKTQPNSHVLLLEKYLQDTDSNKATNEILALMYKTLQSLDASTIIISQNKDQNISAEHKRIYFYEAIADYVHTSERCGRSC